MAAPAHWAPSRTWQFMRDSECSAWPQSSGVPPPSHPLSDPRDRGQSEQGFVIWDFAGTASSDAMSLRFAIASGYAARRATYGLGVASNKMWWVTKETEYYGKIPVRTELTVLPADTVKPCPVCGEEIMNEAVIAHCRRKGDRNHLALEVMET